MITMSEQSEAASQASERLTKSPKRGVIAFILSALHASRRRQALRVLRQYEHLLANELKHDSGEREWSLRTRRYKRA
jgi:hypothetical protein